MNIEGLSKPKILAALFNAARPVGMGRLVYKPDHIMDEQEAAVLLSTQTFFDYLEGRLLKVNLSGNELSTALYNRDQGENAAENAISTALSKW